MCPADVPAGQFHLLVVFASAQEDTEQREHCLIGGVAEKVSSAPICSCDPGPNLNVLLVSLCSRPPTSM